MLTLRDAAGKKVAEDDDVVAGWGGLLGNPDSSLFYTPKQDGDLLIEVRDRQNRGGAAFVYRLKVDHRVPGFQLFTTPENFTVRRGETGPSRSTWCAKPVLAAKWKSGSKAFRPGPLRFARSFGPINCSNPMPTAPI